MSETGAGGGTRVPFGPPDWLEPREYQESAVDAWMAADGRGILSMATGTGKTITSLLAASRLAALQDGRLALVVAVPYQHLVDQWAAELEAFGATPVRAYGSRSTWLDRAVSSITEFELGAREVLVLVTTQQTFAMDHFQRLLKRLPGGRTLLVADEVHHMGAPHLSESLPERVRARLGLSATPERWYDEGGTNALFGYFGGGVVYEYGLTEAIANGYLCPYYYVPHIVELTDDESERYLAISRAIGRLLSETDGELELGAAALEGDETLQRLLIKRARLVGTARNKLDLLKELLGRQEEVRHTLVYCGDGRVPVEDDTDTDEAGVEEIDGAVAAESADLQRQIRAATRRLGAGLGLRVHQFTYEESQAERERLLTDFEAGELQALVAIRCLDEGVDVPATETAYMLASSSNPRQFVQRRGRILRTHEGKRRAVIHDFLVRPPASLRPDTTGSSPFNVERTLVRKELERASTFAEAAMNHPDTTPLGVPNSSGSLLQLKKDFNLLDA